MYAGSISAFFLEVLLIALMCSTFFTTFWMHLKQLLPDFLPRLKPPLILFLRCWLDMTKYVKEAFGYTVVGLACAGVVVNLAALSILMFKKRHSIFHNLLKVLAVYDLLVCCGCALLYGFPNLWDFYADRIYRRLVPWVVPIAHMAMMSSVYSTMLMSFERYIRICHLCQLRNVSYITKENYK